MTNKTLIIGGAGFVGSHLVDVCLEQGYEVGVYDNFSVGKRDYLPAQHSNLKIFESDILDHTSLADAIRQMEPHVVFHLAAIHYIPACEDTPEQALRINVEGTQSILSACAEQRVPRIVFASTGALYDPVTTGALTEASPIEAYNIYSITKLTCEMLIKYYTQKHGLEAAMGRLFNTVGPRETNPHVIPAVMGQLASGKREVRMGNLFPRRDYIHVMDVAAAFFALAQVDLQDQLEIFNIGSGVEHSVQELIELCAEVINEPIEIISDPARKRKVDRHSQLADISKLTQRSDWRPTCTLKQALADAWAEALQTVE